MSWPLIFFIVLLVALFGAIPYWPHARGWGPWPSVVLLVLTLLVGLKVFHVI